MEGTDPASIGLPTERHGNQGANNAVLMSSKPLHRFIQREPKSLGTVIVIVGCAEFLMGFHLVTESIQNSSEMYIPFWQGALFILCGSLSIYTEGHPSKKMVTVCMAMYLVSFFGILFSFGYRTFILKHMEYIQYIRWSDTEWASYQAEQLFAIECILLTTSLCVSVLLIFLCCVARLALKSTNTQVIVRFIPPPAAPQSDTTTN